MNVTDVVAPALTVTAAVPAARLLLTSNPALGKVLTPANTVPAGKVMKGGGYGVLVDIILGILGGVLGGWLFGLLGIWPGGGVIGSIIVAFVGAVILVWISRMLKTRALFIPAGALVASKGPRRLIHGSGGSQ
ncbi:MAG: GlsB/YeaQ/YmgE family stress response membrane protein [Terriglobales bacterium]